MSKLIFKNLPTIEGKINVVGYQEFQEKMLELIENLQNATEQNVLGVDYKFITKTIFESKKIEEDSKEFKNKILENTYELNDLLILVESVTNNARSCRLYYEKAKKNFKQFKINEYLIIYKELIDSLKFDDLPSNLKTFKENFLEEIKNQYFKGVTEDLFEKRHELNLQSIRAEICSKLLLIEIVKEKKLNENLFDFKIDFIDFEKPIVFQGKNIALADINQAMSDEILLAKIRQEELDKLNKDSDVVFGSNVDADDDLKKNVLICDMGNYFFENIKLLISLKEHYKLKNNEDYEILEDFYNRYLEIKEFKNGR